MFWRYSEINEPGTRNGNSRDSRYLFKFQYVLEKISRLNRPLAELVSGKERRIGRIISVGSVSRIFNRKRRFASKPIERLRYRRMQFLFHSVTLRAPP